MLLHEEAFRPPGKIRKARLSRHYYDVWCLIDKGIAKDAMEDIELFERVLNHRILFFRQKWVDYGTIKKGTLRLQPPADSISEWRADYEAMRQGMFFDEPPSFGNILKIIRQFEEEFNS